MRIEEILKEFHLDTEVQVEVRQLAIGERIACPDWNILGFKVARGCGGATLVFGGSPPEFVAASGTCLVVARYYKRAEWSACYLQSVRIFAAEDVQEDVVRFALRKTLRGRDGFGPTLRHQADEEVAELFGGFPAELKSWLRQSIATYN